MNEFPGLILYIATALLGTASAVVAGIWTRKSLRRRGVGAVPAGVLTAMVSIMALGGLWLLFDAAWIVTAITTRASSRGGQRHHSSETPGR